MTTEKDLFTDPKGHRISHASPKRYYEDPEIRATADFIKRMGFKPGKRRPGFDPALLVYAIIIIVMAYLLFIEFGSPKKPTVTVTRTVTEVPVIDEGVEMVAGKQPPESVALSIWWNESLKTSCSGVERFYSGAGFTQDWDGMINKYNSIYCNSGEEAIGMQPPSAMFGNVSNYDCEDMAHATRCLADKYGIQCSFWMKENVGPVVPESEGHLGVCCKTNGDWKCI